MRHRAILDSDIVHLKRATGRDVDACLRVNPRIQERALLRVYNPRCLSLSPYFAGLNDATTIRQRDGEPVKVRLDAGSRVDVKVEVGGV